MDQKQYTAKTTQTKLYRKKFFPLIETENLTDNLNLSGTLSNDSK